ncbi:MAG: inositol monophosphatase [bacterium]|nr:inositol monophosphatase [bacterium]
MDYSTHDLKELEKEIEPIIKAEGEFIRRSWNSIASVSFKDKRDVVTNIDIEVENRLKEKLKKLVPEAGFIVEEGVSEKKEIYNWIIDPVDGTKNYVHQFPLFDTKIALNKGDDPILGQISFPASSQFFSASKGNGATYNGTALKARLRTNPDEAILDLDFGGMEDIEWKIDFLKKCLTNFYRVRIFGGVVNPFLATGAFDAYVSVTRKTKIMDLMPDLIILSEAGVKVKRMQHIHPLFYICGSQELVDFIHTLLPDQKN